MVGWSIALAMLVLRATCRVRVHGDVRSTPLGFRTLRLLDTSRPPGVSGHQQRGEYGRDGFVVRGWGVARAGVSSIGHHGGPRLKPARRSAGSRYAHPARGQRLAGDIGRGWTARATWARSQGNRRPFAENGSRCVKRGTCSLAALGVWSRVGPFPDPQAVLSGRRLFCRAVTPAGRRSGGGVSPENSCLADSAGTGVRFCCAMTMAKCAPPPIAGESAPPTQGSPVF